jgi:hypothetical protein
MSAFVVSEVHINTLITFGASGQNPATVYWERRHISFRGNEQMLADVLMNANVEAVNTRYSDDGQLTGCKFRRAVTLPAPVGILKACDCYDYQTCELANYDATFAAKIIEAVRAKAVRALPGYDDAKWSIY